MRQQQRRFREFQQEYNHQRPHQALGQQVPAALYRASTRPFPQRITGPEYGRDWQVRKVTEGGQVRWSGERLFVSHALSGKQIGFEPLADTLWRVWFYRQWLGIWDERRKILRRPLQCTAETENPSLSPPAGSGQV